MPEMQHSKSSLLQVTDWHRPRPCHNHQNNNNQITPRGLRSRAKIRATRPRRNRGRTRGTRGSSGSGSEARSPLSSWHSTWRRRFHHPGSELGTRGPSIKYEKLTCHQRRVEFERGPVKGPVLLVRVSTRFGRRHGRGPLTGGLRGSRGRLERPDHRHSHDIKRCEPSTSKD